MLPPPAGPWILYGLPDTTSWPLDRCVAIAHTPVAWRLFQGTGEALSARNVEGLITVLPDGSPVPRTSKSISFDVVANAFYFLSSWSERSGNGNSEMRRTYSASIFSALGVPQDIVDQYLRRLIELLNSIREDLEQPRWDPPVWPESATFGLVLSHDVDFIPSGLLDVAKQGLKTAVRHLLHHRDPADAARAMAGLARALVRGRDPYGCVPEIIEREKELGVRASFEVAVGHRHPSDVNYRIEDDGIRDYLRVIVNNGFDLCLHGSYRSTENPTWYHEEAAVLGDRMQRPIGSRQHFLSFDYDALFSAQERAGIEYDMSMGFPDCTGPRAGFSYPYFPYCIKEDRPYRVLQISLFLMDGTLRSYLRLKGGRAWRTIEYTLNDLRQKRGCVSTVWHPIVFGSARDPGYDCLFWKMVDYVRRSGGLATDGRAINDFWRMRASKYPSFAGVSRSV